MYLAILVFGAIIYAVHFSAYLATRATNGTKYEISRQADKMEASGNRAQQGIASLVGVLMLTNGILAGILAVLVYPYLVKAVS